MRGKPNANGAPSSSGTSRPGGTGGIESRPGGPNKFKGQTKHLTESSGDQRSTGPSHRQPLAAQRQAGVGIAPDLADSWNMGKDRGRDGGFGSPAPRASTKTDVSVNVPQNELGNAHGAAPIAGAPPLAR